MLKTVPTTNWLYPEEQREVVERLLELGLIKLDNARSLPLKKGGTTDIYINLRNARNDPRALRFISELFVPPMLRLGVKRFVEVPDSVSCFAGIISCQSGIPFLTIREQSKEGRVGKANLIGDPLRGEPICVFDDVITDGASKIIPIQECAALGLNTRALVVLVDRQQGWKQHLAEAGVCVPVWAGMTLHDVRRELIALGAMRRCDPHVEAKNPIIVALDGKDWGGILSLLDQLRTTGCILKVNDLLFDQGVAHLLPELSVYGRIMVDVKAHDISATVANICKRAKPHLPWGITVHGSGGKNMIRAAVEAFQGTATKVLVVTVLTSIDSVTCEEVYQRLPIDQVKKLAAIAHEAGAHGIVCSPQEVGELRQLYPQMTLVTPGVRSPGADTHDQQRVDTPRAAMDRGSNYLVMGRQILTAKYPPLEVQRVQTEELGLRL